MGEITGDFGESGGTEVRGSEAKLLGGPEFPSLTANLLQGCV